ncbi:MAG: CvpA family protein [Clostridiales bacterium]|nr:CvpA family protein [Clostridiales bacterium]
MNIIDILILIIIGVSVIFGMHRGFISGVLSLAALIGAAALAFMTSGDLAAWLKGNETLVETLMYYTDAGSRVSNLDLSLMSVSQVSDGALAQILASANLPAALESAFITAIESASASMAASATTIAELLSQTIVNVSISILSFLICFFLAYVVATFVIHLVQYVFELPVLRHLDALIGGMFGLVRGVLMVFILFALIPIVLAVAPVEIIEELIAASRLAPMFDSQLILSILRGGI